jgi:hypothetical protein
LKRPAPTFFAFIRRLEDLSKCHHFTGKENKEKIKYFAKLIHALIWWKTKPEFIANARCHTESKEVDSSYVGQ